MPSDSKINQYEVHKCAVRSYCYEEAATKKTIPGIFRVIRIVGIQEDWPLITGHLNLTICKFGANAGSHVHVN